MEQGGGLDEPALGIGTDGARKSSQGSWQSVVLSTHVDSSNLVATGQKDANFGVTDYQWGEHFPQSQCGEPTLLATHFCILQG